MVKQKDAPKPATPSTRGLGIVTALTAEELLTDLQNRHSDFQIKQFMLREPGWTLFGMYMQCLGDIEARYEHLSKLTEDGRQEYEELLRHARELKTELGELTPMKRAALEADMWFHKVEAMAVIDRFLFLHPDVSRDTVEMIIALPPEMRPPLLERVAQLSEPGAADEWVLTVDAPRLPWAPGGNGRELDDGYPALGAGRLRG